MKFFQNLFFFFFIILFSSCGDDTIQASEQQLLSGIVNSEEWDWKFANAFTVGSGIYELKFMSNEEPGNDPCAIPSPSTPYVSMQITPWTGSYTFPTDFVEPPTFYFADGNKLVASSVTFVVDFVSIVEITGYLQAFADDENSIEGSFTASICN